MKKVWYYLILAALGMTACNELQQPAEERIPVTLTYRKVQAVEETKAAQDLNEKVFTTGEAIKVRIRETGTTEWEEYDFTAGESGAMVPGTPAPYYPAGTVTVDIAACYPAAAGTSFSVETDQTSDASYKASDLMFATATGQAKQAASVNLAFSHKMAKINVNIAPGSGVNSIESVSILNVKPTVSFDLATGETGVASGTPTSVTVSNNGAAIIPAQTINGGLLSIATDKGLATYTVRNKLFEAEKAYTLNITVNLQAVGASTAITGWTSEGEVTVNPVVEVPTVLNVTTDHAGWIITADGYIYENKDAVDAAGKEGVALIFYVGEPGSVNGGTNYRGLAIALSEAGSSAWGYDIDEQLCLEEQFAEYTDAVSYLSGDSYGLQNTMNLSTHTHKGDTGHEVKEFAAKKAMNYGQKAPVGTSGWFLGSMVQWDLYLREGCDITAEAIEIEKDPDAGTDDAAEIHVPSTLRSLGAPFAAAGYENPFLPIFYHPDTYYGIFTSTEVSKYYAWSILLDEDSDIDWDEEDDSGSDQMETITFTRFTKGQGLHIYPFLAF